MVDYRSKLRSAKNNPAIEQEDQEKAQVYPESPETPPTESIESYFPPSPFGRKRFQPNGDRFIPVRDRNMARDFQIMDPSSSSSSSKKSNDSESTTPSNTRESRRMSAFFRAELLDDLSAVDEYISSDSNTPRTPRRLLHYTNPTTNNNTTFNASTHHHHHHSTHNYNSNRYSPDFHRESSIPPNLSPSPTLSTHNTDVDSPNSSKYHTSPIGEPGRQILKSVDRFSRQINPTAIKILDAPELQDDFYLNLVDWGPNDCLAVGLGSCVYLWNANTSSVTKLCDFVTDAVTSVNWSHAGSLLAVGINKGRAFLYDTEAQKRIRSWSTHSSRIGSMAWRSNILTTGGRDYAIYHHDVRSPDDYFRKLTSHTQEVCGLKWNPEGTMLASGGNDNNLLIWDSHENKVLKKFSDHNAAVKAISWNPHRRGVLVSGGGTADKTIKFWNTIQGTLTSSHDAGSQVCNIIWSKKTDDIISTHGYANNAASSSNQVIVWKADKMQRLATLTGHTSRVLYMSMSNDGSTVVTGAGDETLRFWDLFSSVEAIRNDPEDRQSCLR